MRAPEKSWGRVCPAPWIHPCPMTESVLISNFRYALAKLKISLTYVRYIPVIVILLFIVLIKVKKSQKVKSIIFIDYRKA